MNGILTRATLPASDLLPKEGRRGAEIRYRSYTPRERLKKKELQNGR